MSSPFREFARVFEEFQDKYPKHPLIEELRNRLSRGHFPSEEWLNSKTSRMRMLMSPAWGQIEGQDRDIAS